MYPPLQNVSAMRDSLRGIVMTILVSVTVYLNTPDPTAGSKYLSTTTYKYLLSFFSECTFHAFQFTKFISWLDYCLCGVFNLVTNHDQIYHAI